MRRLMAFFIGTLFLGLAVVAEALQAGSVRGTVYDKESDTPLAAAQVLIAETGAKTTASDEGSFVFGQVAPGKYTLVFSKDGYTRQVAADVAVSEGEMKDVNASLTGEYTDMDEFVVQKMETGSGTEEGLLNMRMESPALMGSVSSELMSRAGAGDAASALKLVAGATVQDGKYAVVRGLPDRYVNSQMNGVRLPTADVDKRAVQLDQFPSAMIESIQISKTFTPDQQGDASGGAVNVVLKGVPDETILKFKIGTEYNTQTPGNGEFLTYKGGGVNFSGIDDGGRDMQTPGTSWKGAVGVSRGDPPPAYNWTLTAGGKKEVLDGLKIGTLGNFYYKQNSSYYENGVNDTYIATGLKQPMAPATGNERSDPVFTGLFDTTKGSQEVQWGGLGAIGAETENHALSLMYMRTQSTKDTAALAEDTRGKAYFLANPLDPEKPDDPRTAPFWRSEALEYVERKTDTLQLHGSHTLPFPETGIPGYFVLLPPEVDWTVAKSMSGLNSPDKRLFASAWFPEIDQSAWGIPNVPAEFQGKVPPENGNLGYVQRIWKEITEESQQYFVNGKLPFEQWSGDKGYVKFGAFNDAVKRDAKQDSFSNFGDPNKSFTGSWDEYWSSVFPSETHVMTSPGVDVNYKGKQNISAGYWMTDVPLCSFFKVVGGIRYEKTELETVNSPGPNASYISIDGEGRGQPVYLGPLGGSKADPHGADFSLQTNNILPSIGFEFKPVKPLSFRASYSETVARPTFKEITPIKQMEYVGAPVFIGNKELTMSTLKNYDLRADYTPFEGSLLSASWFHKDIINPIEYQQVFYDTLYTMPVNFPKGEITGVEFEARQQLGRFWDLLDGLAVGANATLIKSEVTLPANLANNFPGWAPMKTRDMVNTPSYLYNFNTTYDIKKTGTQLGLFYTVQGDTLVAGASPRPDFTPNVYAKEYGTLNFSVSQKIGEHLKLTFQAKNLLDPAIQEVYRSDYLAGDTIKSSYRKGIDYSLSLGGEF